MNIFDLLEKKSVEELRSSGEFSGENPASTPERPAFKVVGKSPSLPCEKCKLSEMDEAHGIRWCCAVPGHYKNMALLIRCPHGERRRRTGKLAVVNPDVISFDPKMFEKLGCSDCPDQVDGWCMVEKPGSRVNIASLRSCPRDGCSDV